MKVYAAKVSRLSDGIYERLCGLLDSKRLEKVSALKNEKERLRSVYAGLLLRHAFLEEGYGEDMWQRAEVLVGSYGKPYISNCEGFFYSLSHSGEWVICAVDDVETGADIQKVGELKMAVARRFYSEGEYDRLLKYESDKDRQTKELYRMWAAKESCAKYTGRGIGAGISRYVADSDYTHMTDTQTGSQFLIKLYECIPGYIICVCSRRESFPGRIIITGMEGEEIC